jgi:high-affinity Fe2+/Pb2+ permease
MQGEVTEALGSVEWKSQDAFGSNYVTIARRGGRTTIAVLSTRSDSAAVAWMAGGLGAFFGSLGIGSALVSTVGLAGPLAAIAGVGLASGGAWLSTRAAWRRYARGVGGRIETLGSALVAAARSAVEEGRVRGR